MLSLFPLLPTLQACRLSHCLSHPCLLGPRGYLNRYLVVPLLVGYFWLSVQCGCRRPWRSSLHGNFCYLCGLMSRKYRSQIFWAIAATSVQISGTWCTGLEPEQKDRLHFPTTLIPFLLYLEYISLSVNALMTERWSLPCLCPDVRWVGTDVQSCIPES